LGFQPIDTTQVGLHGDPAWVEEARRVQHPPTVMPPAESTDGPREVRDDFEPAAVGSAPSGAIVSGEQAGASIRVSDEQAAGGRHSLKIKDAAGVEPAWQPHLFYQPHLADIAVRQSFDLRLTDGSLLFTEWRDEGTYPACIGPSVTFDQAGRVLVAGRPLTTVPLNTWIHVEIECMLGKDAPPGFSLAVTTPPAGRQVFAGLPIPGHEFRELHWLGFVSTAAVDTACFIDNVEIRRVPR
jgi:hypothetical protein